MALPRIPNLRGIKHTSPSLPTMHLLLEKFGDRVDVVLGMDDARLEGLAIGITGSIIQSFDAVVLGRVKEAFDRGDLTAARKEQVPTAFESVASRPLGQGPTLNAPKTTFIQKKKNKKNLNPCHHMLFLGSKYAKIAFAAGVPDPAGGAQVRDPLAAI